MNEKKNTAWQNAKGKIEHGIAPLLAARAVELIENYRLAKIVTALVFVRMTAVATCRRMLDTPGVSEQWQQVSR